LFGIGGPELAVILVLGLILVGPKKLPQVARTVGAGIRDLKRAANMAQTEFRETVDELMREADLDDTLTQLRNDIDPNMPLTHNKPKDRLTGWKERGALADEERDKHPDEGWHFDDDDDPADALEDESDDEPALIEDGNANAEPATLLEEPAESGGIRPEPAPDPPPATPEPVEGTVSWRPPAAEATEES